MADANAVGQVVVRGAQGARSAASKAEHGGSAFDVWTRTDEGQAEAAGQTTGLLNMPLAPVESGTSVGALPTAMGQQVDALKQAAADFGKANGALATAGAVMGALTTLEQAISTPLSAIPFPAYPAIRVMDMDVGLPHAHSHPPNLVPPAPPVPLPSTGPVIPIPYVSGAATVLINGMPAGRCGDMGMGIWCGSYFPMYEIFLGSSSVWIEGMRAARLGVDITKHCIFSVPKPQDLPIGPMIGMTISSSANVVIGGVPMPSLTNMAIGAVIKAAFAGFGKVVRGLRAAVQAEAKASAEAAAKAETEAVEKAAREAAVVEAKRAASKALDEMYERVPAAKAEIDEVADALAESYGGRVAKAPPKGKERALEKVLSDYGGDASRVSDLARNIIIVPKDKVDDIACELERYGAAVKRVDASSNPLGYSGINSKVNTKTGLGAEIQVNTPEMIFAKESSKDARAILGDAEYNALAARFPAPGGQGHELYEKWRSLPPGSPERSAIEVESVEYYKHFQ